MSGFFFPPQKWKDRSFCVHMDSLIETLADFFWIFVVNFHIISTVVWENQTRSAVSEILTTLSSSKSLKWHFPPLCCLMFGVNCSSWPVSATFHAMCCCHMIGLLAMFINKRKWVLVFLLKWPAVSMPSSLYHYTQNYNLQQVGDMKHTKFPLLSFAPRQRFHKKKWLTQWH